jgi:endonuclease/exonuclease/phosphatase family metal-dependent hydrolase
MALLTLAGVTLLRWGQDDIVLGLPPGDSGGEKTATEFTLLSYNVQARPWLDDAGEKLPKIAPLLDGYDVVALQECFQQHRLVWAGTSHPNKVHFGRLAHPFKLAGPGLALLSRLPVGAVVTEHFTRNGELQNRVASKGIALVRVHAGGWVVDVYNTHMEAGGRPEAQPARMAQALQVVDFVTRHSPPAHGVVLCGDFNMMPLRPEKAPEDYRPGHFDNLEDLAGRTAAFQAMFEGLGLRDASDELFGPTRDDIERFLFRAPEGGVMTPLSLEQDTNRFRRADGSSLSDGSPYIARFRLAPAAP